MFYSLGDDGMEYLQSISMDGHQRNDQDTIHTMRSTFGMEMEMRRTAYRLYLASCLPHRCGCQIARTPDQCLTMPSLGRPTRYHLQQL
jgi:hypothetical protein